MRYSPGKKTRRASLYIVRQRRCSQRRLTRLGGLTQLNVVSCQLLKMSTSKYYASSQKVHILFFEQLSQNSTDSNTLEGYK